MGSFPRRRFALTSLHGIYPIVPTPFDADGRIDEASIASLAAFMLERGIQGLAILGVMGEAQKLTDAERDQVVAAFRAALPKGRALIVGTGAAATDPALAACARAADLGADGLLVAPPAVQNDDAIFEYYRRIDAATPLPVVLHDYPPSTGILMSVPLIARLHRDLARVRYIKVEDAPTGPKIERLHQAAGPGLGIFGALGGAYAFEELDRGAIGIMTGFAYPEVLVEIQRRYEFGDRAGAAALFYDALPLIRWEFQPGLGVSLRKEILVRRGAIRHAAVRHPGAVADAKTLEHLDLILDHLRGRGVIA